MVKNSVRHQVFIPKAFMHSNNFRLTRMEEVALQCSRYFTRSRKFVDSNPGWNNGQTVSRTQERKYLLGNVFGRWPENFLDSRTNKFKRLFY